MFKKLKQIWQWSTGYKAVFVTPDRTFTLEHRIGRAPRMTSTKTPDVLRGASANVVIFDEYVFQQELDNFELPSTSVVYRNKK